MGQSVRVAEMTPDTLNLPLGQHRRPCPQCDRGPRDRALSIKIDGDGATFICHRCGYTGADNPTRDTYPRAPRQEPKADPLEWSAAAEAIWRRTQGLRRTLGATYLQSRGCAMPPRDSHLRFLPADGSYPPSLCAAVTDVLTAKPISLHFTRLAADGGGKAGGDCDRRLLKGHRKAGGCIRLWPDSDVHSGLAIAEGIETSLAAAHAFTPVWSCVDAGNMAAFPVLPGVESLTIFADNDPAGIRASAAVADRWAAAGREVRLVMPPTVGADVNDMVRQ